MGKIMLGIAAVCLGNILCFVAQEGLKAGRGFRVGVTYAGGAGQRLRVVPGKRCGFGPGKRC